jgi:2,4-dienoyl-CoA reductase-like NADH-dependent reductase (Old Yellow Enzyme family)
MPRLSDPFSVKGLRLRNRLVMAPMVTGMAVDHAPGPAQLEWYRSHAASGVGLVVVEACAVARDATILPHVLGAWDDGQVEGLARLARAIQAEGVPAVLQIVHGGAKAWREDLAQERVAPSAVPLMPGPAPRALEEPEILALVEAFAQAAARARAAGFDGVEIHAAHYYLVSQFLSPYANRRTDRWGGDVAGRARFGVEVTRAVRRAVGPDYPIFCRMHGMELFEGGMSAEDAAASAQAFRDAGVDVLDASAIGSSSRGEWQGQSFLNTSSVLPKGGPAGAYAAGAGRLREAAGIPVIAVGKLGEPGVAQQVLDRGQADLVALARQLIADPRAAEKLLAGRDADIQRCQECLTCFASIRKGPVKCGINKAL